MRTRLLLFILLCPVLAFSQEYEIGLNGGVSINSKPTNNMPFRGNRVAANYATELSCLKNVDDKWQVGVDIHMLELSRRSNVNYNNDGTVIGTDNKKFVYATYAYSFLVVANRKFYMDDNYFYVGAGMGAGIARNNSKTLPVDASYEAPDGGFGLSVGLQAGYSVNFRAHWGLNLEIAARYYDLDYDAHAPVVKPYTNIHYRIVSYPATIGVRYRFGYEKKLNKMGETILVK